MSAQGASVASLGLDFPPMLQEPSELRALIELVEQNLGGPPRSVLEIGVHLGGTLSRFRALWPGAAVIGVDVVEPAPIEGVHFVIGPSQSRVVQAQAEELLGGEPVDFVHIDGDHTLDAAAEDYRWARDGLRARMIALHDVAPFDQNPDGTGVFDVWRLWHEIKCSDTPAVEIRHNREGRFGYGVALTRG